MKTVDLIKTAVLVAASGLAMTAPQAHGNVRCEAVPKAEWRPQADLEQQLKAEGSKVSRVKEHNGCYEVYGIDAKGRKFENFYDPKTLDRVKPDDAKS